MMGNAWLAMLGSGAAGLGLAILFRVPASVQSDAYGAFLIGLTLAGVVLNLIAFAKQERK